MKKGSETCQGLLSNEECDSLNSSTSSESDDELKDLYYSHITWLKETDYTNYEKLIQKLIPAIKELNEFKCNAGNKNYTSHIEKANKLLYKINTEFSSILKDNASKKYKNLDEHLSELQAELQIIKKLNARRAFTKGRVGGKTHTDVKSFFRSKSHPILPRAEGDKNKTSEDETPRSDDSSQAKTSSSDLSPGRGLSKAKDKSRSPRESEEQDTPRTANIPS